MSPDVYEILPGALIVSDAHYSRRRPELLAFFRAILSGELETPQLILAGDIFDLLFGQIEKTHRLNGEAVKALRHISETVPVLYLEGNHDYNLSGLFPHATVVPRSRQPFACRFADTSLLLAHGDFNQPLTYSLYTAVIRNPVVLHLLDAIDTLGNGAILRRLERYLEKKDDCYTIDGFEALTRRHLEGVAMHDATVFVEGHYHQGVTFAFDGLRYVNLPAFACDRKYVMVSKERSERTFAWQTVQWKEGCGSRT